MNPLIFQSPWVFFFLGLPTHSPKDDSNPTPLALQLSHRWSSKVFGQLLGMGKVWAGLRPERKENLRLSVAG
jgi:hypothetical protein